MTSVIHLIVFTVLASTSVSVSVSALTSTSAPKLTCRRCNNAVSLADCINSVRCESNEECYMDQLITEQLTILYNGGCRPREVCAAGNSGHLGRKRQVLVGCSGCCNQGNDCNKRLCGKPDPTLSANQCYSCKATPTSAGNCVNLTTCQSSEMCSVQTSIVSGHTEYLYGCKSKFICRILMDQTFQELKRCENDPALCVGIGAVGRRATTTCNACCGDSGCNYGSCMGLQQRLYSLSKVGNLLDLTTLKISGNAYLTTPTASSGPSVGR